MLSFVSCAKSGIAPCHILLLSDSPLLHNTSFLGLCHLIDPQHESFCSLLNRPAFVPPGLRPRRVSSTPLRSEPASSTPIAVSNLTCLPAAQGAALRPVASAAVCWLGKAGEKTVAHDGRAVARPSPPDEPLAMLLLLPPTAGPVAPASCYTDRSPTIRSPLFRSNSSTGHARPARLHHPSSSLASGGSSDPPATLSATLISENWAFPTQPTVPLHA